MYSQFFKIGEVLEHIGWKLSDVVHAQVTVETKTSVRNTVNALMESFISLLTFKPFRS